MTNSVNQNKVADRFLLLDGMRGFAALGVLAFHAVVVTNFMYLDNLYLLVDFFFVLSGFVLAPSMPSSFVGYPKAATKFIIKRIFRFWPVLIAVLGFTAGLYAIAQSDPNAWPDPNFSNHNFLISFLLLHVIFSSAIALNWPLWSLSAEWFANLIFLPLTPIKANIGLILGVILGYVALIYGLNTDQEFIGDSWSYGSGPIRGFEALGRAMIGFGLGLLIRRYHQQLKRLINPWMLVISLVLAWVLFQSHGFFQGETVYFTTYFAGPVFALVVLQASNFNPRPSGAVGRTLSFLGKMSFGIYAYHVVVLIAFESIVPPPVFPENPGSEDWITYLLTKIFVAAAVSFVLAYATHWIFEKPAQKLQKVILTATKL
jgi:peptidoglycan/LPS O-acetylase OafA/YrhL